ncbi:UNVERIFIED_CONTAM: hypothetical protein FKN15_051758 [Acipenser sinensis]
MLKASSAVHVELVALQELNQYPFFTVELSVCYRGTMFYEYHCAFSAKAAATLSANNRIVDWSRSDPDLFTRIFSGIHANACSVCTSTAHSTYLCPKAAAGSFKPSSRSLPSLLGSRQPPSASSHASAPPTRSQTQDIYGRPIKFSGGRQISNNFNSSACFNQSCIQVPSAGPICFPNPPVPPDAVRLNPTLRNLLKSSQHYMSAALAPSSRASYSTAWIDSTCI